MGLSPEQIQSGFWIWIRANKHVPDQITYFKDYKPSETLVLEITS
jgi:hypothetical protein